MIDPEEIKRQQALADETKALQDAFAKFRQTGIVVHKSDAELLATFREGREIVVDNGLALVRYDGELLPLNVALTRYAFDAPAGEVDRRTLPRTGITARPGITSKADLKSVQEKVAYIRENGADAFDALPLQPVQTEEITLRSQWYRLSVEERVRRTAADPDAFSKLKADPVSKIGGAFINNELMERTNPNYRGPGWSRKALAKVR